MKKLTLVLFAVLGFELSFAQINVPRPSPVGTVTQNVGLTEASITYSRPSMKGRKIFGSLVQYDQMWRTGANESTKIKFADDVTIEGNDVPAGEYALYTIPGKESWTIILHTNLSYWGTGGKDYDPAEDLIRFKVKPNNNYPVSIETLTFNFTNIKDDECYIEMLWENTQVRFKLKTEVDKKVMSEIDQKMKGVSAATYYQAARYYLEHDKDLNKALEWIDLALEEDEKFWIVRQKALILAKMENYKEAIKAAERSKELAEAANNSDYVRMNNESIAEWSKK
jgi:hypothetical protein